MWEYKKVYQKIFMYFLKYFLKKIPTFPQPLLCMGIPTETRQEYENTDVGIENKCGMVMVQSVNVGNLWKSISHKLFYALHQE